jgi:hypothetical protein
MKGQKTGGRRAGTPNRATQEIREASLELLSRPAYRASLEARLDAGKAPHMETLLHHYAFGKPREDRAEGVQIILGGGVEPPAFPRLL